MHDVENPEEGKVPENSTEWPFTKELTEAWRRLEERTRRRPGPHLSVALVVGYFLQLFPFRSLLMLFLKLCLILARPALLLFCAFQLVKHVRKSSDADAASS